MPKRPGNCSSHGTFSATVVASALFAACAGAPVVPDKAVRAAGVPHGAHELTCQYGKLEAVQGVRDLGSDSSSLFLVLTIPEANVPAPRKVIAPAVQVQRSRPHEPFAEVGLLPQSACAPELRPAPIPSS